jgi:hypothetical protein
VFEVDDRGVVGTSQSATAAANPDGDDEVSVSGTGRHVIERKRPTAMPVDDQRVIVGLPYAVPGGRPRRCRVVRLRLYKPSASINHDAARERTRQDDWDLA